MISLTFEVKQFLNARHNHVFFDPTGAQGMLISVRKSPPFSGSSLSRGFNSGGAEGGAQFDVKAVFSMS